MADASVSVDFMRIFEVQIGDRPRRAVGRLLRKLHEKRVAEGCDGFIVRVFPTKPQSKKPRGTPWVNMTALRAAYPTPDMATLAARVDEVVNDHALLKDDVEELAERQDTDRKHLNALKGEVHRRVFPAVKALEEELPVVKKKLEQLAFAFAAAGQAA